MDDIRHKNLTQYKNSADLPPNQPRVEKRLTILMEEPLWSCIAIDATGKGVSRARIIREIVRKYYFPKKDR